MSDDNRTQEAKLSSAIDVRRALAEQLENEIRPLIAKDMRQEGGYDCCGCDTYDQILDHAIRIVLGETTVNDLPEILEE